jgi:hypothetical protein
LESKQVSEAKDAIEALVKLPRERDEPKMKAARDGAKKR